MASTLYSLSRSLAKTLWGNTGSRNFWVVWSAGTMKMKFCNRRGFYLDLGFNTTKMEVLCWQVFYVISGHCILLPRERGRNLDSKAILTKDKQCALVLHKNTKNTNIGQIHKWNWDKCEEKRVRQMHRHKAKLQPHLPVFCGHF